jgi:hypothetical protein
MRVAAAAVAATLLIVTAHAQAPSARDFRIIRLDPALDAIVAPDATLETLGDRFGLTEGPVWVPDPAGAYLAFSDLTANVVYKRTSDGRFSVLAENIVAAGSRTAASRCSTTTATFPTPSRTASRGRKTSATSTSRSAARSFATTCAPTARSPIAASSSMWPGHHSASRDPGRAAASGVRDQRRLWRRRRPRLYITACNLLYRVRLKTPGVRPGPAAASAR